MAEIILCPKCQRRLRLPEDSHGRLVCCPSCQTEFTAAADIPTVLLADEAPPVQRPASPPPRTDPDDEAPRRRPRPRRLRPSSATPQRSAWRWIAVGVLILVTLGGIVAVVSDVFSRHRETTPPRPRVVENEKDRHEEMKAAFKDNKPLNEDEIVGQLKPVFEDLGAALTARDSARVVAHFDVDRMADELGPLPGINLDNPRQRQGFVSGMGQGLGNSLAGPQAILRWQSFEIRSVKKLNDDEAVAIVRHRHPTGATLKFRWWMTRRSGAWRVYDLEDLDGGMRVSVTIGSAAQGIGNFPDGSRAVKALAEALQALALRQDFATAERKLDSIAAVQLPRELDAVRFMARALIHLAKGQAHAALEDIDKAHELHPDMPVLDVLKGRAYSQLKKWDEAVKHFQAYRDLLGDDSEVCRELGLALRWTKRFPEAAEVYRKALDLNPKDADAFDGLLSSLQGKDDQGDLGDRFLKLDNLRVHFNEYAADLEKRDMPELVETLALAMQKVDPQYPRVDYYLAVAKARTGHAAQAVLLFKSALARQPDDESRRDCTEGFLKAMTKVGKLADAYAAVPDSRESFRFAAAEGLKQYRLDDLKRLLAIHRKNDAADPLLAWYQAAVYARDERYVLADRTFTTALAAPPDAETLATFRADRVTACYYTGQALSAYRDIGPRKDTFRQLAQLALRDEDYALLQQLLDLHEKNDPLSIDLSHFRYRLKIRQGQTAEGIAIFQKALRVEVWDAKEKAEWVSEFLGEMITAGKPLEGYRAAPDAKKAFFILAEDLTEDERLDDLRPVIAAHRKDYPADPWLALYQGDIDLADKAWEKAADGLWDGMKAAPKDLKGRFHRKVVYAFYQAGRWKRAYEEIEPRDQTFTQLANLLEQDKKAAELEALCRAHQVRAADDPELLLYRALAKVYVKKADEAAALIAEAYRKEPNAYSRRNYSDRFVRAMNNQGLMMEGYRAAPDKSAAFQTLASELVAKKKEKELATLLSEHERGREIDRWCDFYRGEWHLLRGEADKAGLSFAAALKKAGRDESWRFRNGLFRARVKSGQAVATYREIEPRTQTFADLASMCVEEKAADQLQSLIEVHRKDDPEDAETARWELEWRWLKQDYEGVLKLLREHGEDFFELPLHRWKADDYRVRSLVKLKRSDEAIRAAEAVDKRRGNRLLLVLAHAAAGDVKRTIAILEKLKSPTYLVGSCYGDADLGSILRSEAFAAFRDKFPEPK